MSSQTPSPVLREQSLIRRDPLLQPACQNNFGFLVVAVVQVQLLVHNNDPESLIPRGPTPPPTLMSACQSRIRHGLPSTPSTFPFLQGWRYQQRRHGRGIMPGTCQPLPTLPPCQHPLHIWICRACVPPISLSTNSYFWTLCHCGASGGGAWPELAWRWL